MQRTCSAFRGAAHQRRPKGLYLHVAPHMPKKHVCVPRNKKIVLETTNTLTTKLLQKGMGGEEIDQKERKPFLTFGFCISKQQERKISFGGRGALEPAFSVELWEGVIQRRWEFQPSPLALPQEHLRNPNQIEIFQPWTQKPPFCVHLNQTHQTGRNLTWPRWGELVVFALFWWPSRAYLCTSNSWPNTCWFGFSSHNSSL